MKASHSLHRLHNTLLCMILMSATLSCESEIAVERITVNPTTLELIEGDSYILRAVITPSDATNKTVTWSSNKPSIVSAYSNGEIVALEPGSATVTAMSEDGGKKASCEVTVIARTYPVIGIKLNAELLNMRVGEQSSLEATISPHNATNKNIIWSSSDESVASVTGTGVVSALKEGNAIISAKTEDGGFVAQCSIVVTVAVSGITISETEITVSEGESKTITAIINPDNATNQDVSWESSNPDIATVTNGVIRGVYAGTAVITVKTNDGEKTASCVVNVIAHPESVSLDNKSISLERGSSKRLSATVLPERTNNKKLLWSSSNTDVATVTDGLVYANGAGSTIITVTTEDGGLTDTCDVTVIVSVSQLTIEPANISLLAGETSSLSLTILPSDATERNITWSSTDPSVASVNNAGVVSALKGGTAIIKATADNSVSASCTVTVIVPVTGVSVNPPTLVIEQYTSSTVTAIVEPGDATVKSVKWETSNPSIATVSNGVVQALAPGEVSITATTVDGNFSASCSVTVEKAPTKATSLSFAGTALYVGSQPYQLTVSVEPSDAVCNLTWSCPSGPVSIDGSGTTVTVSKQYNSTSSPTITVTDQRTGLSASIKAYTFIESFSWQESSDQTYAGSPLITIGVGYSHKLSYTSSAGSNVLNLFGNQSDFVFYEPSTVVSNPSNISLSPDGIVTGIKDGTTGIKPTGTISGGGGRLYFKVASELNESEYNDDQNYANTVYYGIPMTFYLSNASDVDWFKLLTNTDKQGQITVTITVEYTGASSLTGSEARLCKYSLYDSSMQLWGAGSFTFNNSSPSSSTVRQLPNGPMYLKVYFEGYDGLRPTAFMKLRMEVNE